MESPSFSSHDSSHVMVFQDFSGFNWVKNPQNLSPEKNPKTSEAELQGLWPFLQILRRSRSEGSAVEIS